jgi:gluconolactonase
MNRRDCRRLWPCAILASIAVVICDSSPAAEPLDFHAIRPKIYVEVPGGPEMEPWSEAPAWRGGEVFFANRPFVRVTRDRQPQKYLNLHVAGTFLRSNGHILACEHFHKSLLDIAPDGTVSVVADRDADGTPLRGLNDLTADAAGNVYWTDPTDSGIDKPVGRIYRVTPEGRVELLASDRAFPNGIEVDPESKHLYVMESQTKRVLRYRLPGSGERLGEPSMFYQFEGGAGPDGCAFDESGNLWVAEFASNGGNGKLVVLSAEGKPVGEVQVGARLVTNVCFGGPNRDEIFISTGGPSGVFHAKAGVRGFAGHPVRELKLWRRLGIKPLDEPISTAADRKRHAELLIYHPIAGKLDAVVELIGKSVALKRRHGMNPLASWASADRAANEAVAVELLAPPSQRAGEEAANAAAQDAEFAKLQGEIEKACSKIETIALVSPADQWKLSNNNKRPRRAIDLRLYTRSPEKEAAFRDRWRDHAVRIYERHGMDNLGWWEATGEGQAAIMVTLFAHESVDAINSTIGAFHKDEEWIAIEKETEAGGKLRTAARAYKLLPTDFSPIK